MARRVTGSGEFDWADAYRRIASADPALGGDDDGRPEEARRTLEDRARVLARPLRTGVALSEAFVTFSLAGEHYAIEARYVIEVFRPGRVTPLPGATAPVSGLVGWRGTLLTIVNLRTALGLASVTGSAPGRALVLGMEGVSGGILADEVHEFVNLPSSAVAETPEGVAARRPLVRGITGGAVLVLDGSELLRSFA